MDEIKILAGPYDYQVSRADRDWAVSDPACELCLREIDLTAGQKWFMATRDPNRRDPAMIICEDCRLKIVDE
jgi:hypothetical protein